MLPRHGSSTPRRRLSPNGVGRFRADGVDGLRDRSSRPHSLPSQTPVTTCTAIETLRRQRHTGKHIAAEVGVSAAIVSRILLRLGLNTLSTLEPAEPNRRYQRENPGELIHIDISANSTGSALRESLNSRPEPPAIDRRPEAGRVRAALCREGVWRPS
jgi:hypothetical protein